MGQAFSSEKEQEQGKAEEGKAEIIPSVPTLFIGLEFKKLEHRSSGTTVPAIGHRDKSRPNQANQCKGYGYSPSHFPDIGVKGFEDSQPVGRGREGENDHQREDKCVEPG